jgi:hypothetical protein
MRRGSTPESRGGRQRSTPNKTLLAKAAHLLAAAGESAKTPLFSAYIRVFELAEDHGGELTVTRARRPHNQTEIAECGAPLARILNDLLPYEKPRRTTAQVQTTRITPFRSATASWRSCDAQCSRPRWWTTHGEKFEVRSLRGGRFYPCRHVERFSMLSRTPMAAGPSVRSCRPPGDRGASRQGIRLFYISA